MLVVDLLCTEPFKFSGWSYVCVFCEKRYVDGRLYKCSGCKLVFYCSKLHQVQHWDFHKYFCKVVKSILKTRGITNMFSTVDGTGRLIIENAQKVRTAFNLCFHKPITHTDDSLLFHPFVCNVCDVYKPNEMIVCQNCSIVAYCCKEHLNLDEAQHSSLCDDYKQCVYYDINCSTDFIIFLKIYETKEFPESMNIFLEKLTALRTMPPGKEKYAAWFLSNSLSTMLTIMYVIVKTKLMDKLEGDTLTLHIVSPQLRDGRGLWAWEYIFHFFPKLKTLNVFFIGPISDSLDLLFFVKPSPLICRKCIDSCVINPRTMNMDYSKFIELNISHPNMIFSFNFPLTKVTTPSHEIKRYYESLFYYKDVVVGLTSFGEVSSLEKLDILKDCNKKFKAEFIIENELNPFKSLIPLPYLKSEFGNGAYRNKYIHVFKK